MGEELLVAFYLPQFYRTESNNRWWGEGFTEWTNVSKARPVFNSHHQPQIPGELGFYDTTHPKTIPEQVSLAKSHGIGAFCFYNYWFSGERLLEKPLEIFVESIKDFPFMVCWANENWTKNWDGGNREILIEQRYTDGWEEEYVKSIAFALGAKNYLTRNSRPVIAIYKPADMPNPKQSIAKIRQSVEDLGFENPFILSVKTNEFDWESDLGVDGVIDFPPLGYGPNSETSRPASCLGEFSGKFYDYGLAALHGAAIESAKVKLFHGIMPGWDNTARRQNDSSIFLNSSPTLFKHWLTVLRMKAREAQVGDGTQEYIFINAWNEWAEGAVLEPSRKFARGYLEAIIESRDMAQSLRSSGEAVDLLEATISITNSYSNQLLTTQENGIRTGFRFFRALAAEANARNVKKAFSLLSVQGTRVNFFRILFRAVRNVANARISWEPKSFVKERVKELNPGISAKLAVSIHIYYDEFLDRAITVMNTFPIKADFFITVANESQRSSILEKTNASVELSVKISENRGRNFGPMLVEYGGIFQQYEYLIHLHSKMSRHTDPEIASKWSMSGWNLLGTGGSLIQRAINLLADNKDISVVYPSSHKVVPPASFAWHSNLQIAKDFCQKQNIEFVDKQFPFPAGGMFALRVADYPEIFSRVWTYEDFPKEIGQLDGTMQHVIERLIGYIPNRKGKKQAAYFFEKDRFSTDTEF